jgi:uncharacterized membrane protein HdeD (DUF308 family)
MDDVTRLANEWWLLAILGGVSLIAGVLAIVYPDITLLAMGVIFGCYLLLAGIFELVNAIVGEPASRALSAIIGIYLIVTAVVKFVRAFDTPEDRGWVILSALADLVLGIVILAVPDLSLVTVAVLFGISLILRGVFACVAAFKLRKVHKEGADVAPPFGAAPA